MLSETEKVSIELGILTIIYYLCIKSRSVDQPWFSVAPLSRPWQNAGDSKRGMK